MAEIRPKDPYNDNTGIILSVYRKWTLRKFTDMEPYSYGWEFFLSVDSYFKKNKQNTYMQ